MDARDQIAQTSECRKKQRQIIKGLQESHGFDQSIIAELIESIEKTGRAPLEPKDSLIVRNAKMLLNLLADIDMLATQILPPIFQTQALASQFMDSYHQTNKYLGSIFQSQSLSEGIQFSVASMFSMVEAHIYGAVVLLKGAKTAVDIKSKMPELMQFKYDIIQTLFYLRALKKAILQMSSSDDLLLSIGQFEEWIRQAILSSVLTIKYLAQGATEEEKAMLANINATVEFAMGEMLEQNSENKNADKKSVEPTNKKFLSGETRARIDSLIAFEQKQQSPLQDRIDTLEKTKQMISYLERISNFTAKAKNSKLNALGSVGDVLNDLGHFIKTLESIDFNKLLASELNEILKELVTEVRPLLVSVTMLLESAETKLGLTTSELQAQLLKLTRNYDEYCLSIERPELALHDCWKEKLEFRYTEKINLEKTKLEASDARDFIANFTFNKNTSLYQLSQLRLAAMKLGKTTPFAVSFIEKIDNLVRSRTGLDRLLYEIEKQENIILEKSKTGESIEKDVILLKRLYKTCNALEKNIQLSSESERPDQFSYQGDPLIILTEFKSFGSTTAFDKSRQKLIDESNFTLQSLADNIEKLDQRITEAEKEVIALPEEKSEVSFARSESSLEDPLPIVPPIAMQYDIKEKTEALLERLQLDRKGPISLKLNAAQSTILNACRSWLNESIFERMLMSDKDAAGRLMLRADDPLLFRSLKTILNALHEMESMMGEIELMRHNKKIFLDMKLSGFVDAAFAKANLGGAFIDLYQNRWPSLKNSIDQAYFELQELIKQGGLLLPKEVVDVLQTQLTTSTALLESQIVEEGQVPVLSRQDSRENLLETPELEKKITLSSVLYEISQTIKPSETSPQTDYTQGIALFSDLLEKLSKMSDLFVQYADAGKMKSLAILTQLYEIGVGLKQSKQEGKDIAENVMTSLNEILSLLSPTIQAIRATSLLATRLYGLADKNMILDQLNPVLSLFDAFSDAMGSDINQRNKSYLAAEYLINEFVMLENAASKLSQQPDTRSFQESTILQTIFDLQQQSASDISTLHEKSMIALEALNELAVTIHDAKFSGILSILSDELLAMKKTLDGLQPMEAEEKSVIAQQKLLGTISPSSALLILSTLNHPATIEEKKLCLIQLLIKQYPDQGSRKAYESCFDPDLTPREQLEKLDKLAKEGNTQLGRSIRKNSDPTLDDLIILMTQQDKLARDHSSPSRKDSSSAHILGALSSPARSSLEEKSENSADHEIVPAGKKVKLSIASKLKQALHKAPEAAPAVSEVNPKRNSIETKG
ncbi:MAG: hypothetical protein SFW66_09890 [Gammaproteobacteria bacterium]|nr:hypothetical protein [Gammaproteobacteria bacterium]